MNKVLYNRNVLKNYVINLKKNPCLDCGKTFHPVCMDFDHVRGVKRMGVSIIIKNGMSLEFLKEEIAKCDLVCANCHRIRTLGSEEGLNKQVQLIQAGRSIDNKYRRCIFQSSSLILERENSR
jgi:hypothetical protein